ncbi:MAG: methyltransferase [Saprospiraceae bacterium]|nr:methyltransferase [Saprospiraceae bacterium]
MLKEKSTLNKPFTFKQFKIHQDRCAMKVGTDGVLLGAWSDVSNAQSILDVGTGTGVIAIMLAQKVGNTEGALVHAVEIDEMAVEQAKENMADSPFASKLTVYHDSIQNFAKNHIHKYDLVVSNPPFFTGGTLSSNGDKTNVRHTVKLPHGDLLNATRELLNKNGRFCVILPLIEGLRFIEIARTYGFYLTHRSDVRPKQDKGIERLLLQFELTNRTFSHDELIIQNSRDERDYTEGYRELTKDFYTIF